MAHKTDKQILFEQMHLAGGMPLNEGMDLNDEANWAQDLDESRLGDMASAVFKTIGSKINISNWSSPQGQSARKGLVQKIDAALSGLKSIIVSSMSDAEKVKQTQKLFKLPIIAAATMMIIGFIKNTGRVAQEVAREGALGDFIRFLGGEGTHTVHTMEYGGEVGLKLLIAALVLKVLHYVISKGKLTTDVITQQWDEVKSTYQEHLDAAQNDQGQTPLPQDVKNENYPWGAKDDPAAPWNEPELPKDGEDGEEYEPDPDERHDIDHGVNEIFDWSQKYKYPDNAETYQKLLDTAQKEGHITAHQAIAEYISATAKEIAAEFDSLGNDTLWGLYYKEFLTKINKIGTLNLRINEKDDDWIQNAVNPDHKGYCTPMTKDTCTPPRKALAKRFKKGIEDESVMETKKLKEKNLLLERMHKVTGMPLNEGKDGFERKVAFWVYSTDGEYLGGTDPIDDEMYINEPEELFMTPEWDKFAKENNVTPEQIGEIKRDLVYTMDGKQLQVSYYSPSQSQELYDPETNTWYNTSGSQMRDPSEYERYSDGTNQWGERYDDDY